MKISTSSVPSIPSTSRTATRRTGKRASSISRPRRAPSVALLALGVVVHRGLHALRALAEQKIVEHCARDRRRGAGTEAAVLDDHRERDLRILHRREGDEPGMVA